MKQEMMGWQWHQQDYMQIICTSLRTDNHAKVGQNLKKFDFNATSCIT